MRTPAAVLSPEYQYLAPPRYAHYCTSALNRLSDACWERRLNVATTCGASSDHGDERRSGHFAYHTAFAILDALALRSDDVVIDVGSGPGRVVCAAATYPIREAIGVEIDADLATIAAGNAARMRGRRAPIRFVCQSALEFDFDPATVVIMFHPFGPGTMQAFLRRLGESLERRPRMLRLVYVNPWLAPLVAAQPWLELYDAWHPGTWTRLKFPAHFYCSTSQPNQADCEPAPPAWSDEDAIEQ
jgi:SAM-dependent methyltransferase